MKVARKRRGGKCDILTRQVQLSDSTLARKRSGGKCDKAGAVK